MNQENLVKIPLYKGKVVIWAKKGDIWGNTYYKSDNDGNPDFSERLLSPSAFTGVLDKPALIFWALDLMATHILNNIQPGQVIQLSQLLSVVEAGKNMHRAKKEEAGDTGTLIHDWIDAWILWTLKINKVRPAMPEEELVLNGVNAFLKWTKEHKVKFLESEKVVYSIIHNAAGRLDITAEVDDKYTLLDVKTSNMWQKDKAAADGLKRDKSGNLVPYEPHLEWRYQTAFYRGAKEEEEKRKFTGDRIILWIDKMFGNMRPVQLDNYEKDMACAAACMVLKRRELELSKYGKY